MLTKIDAVNQNPNFGIIKLPAKGTNGYDILLKRMKRTDYPKLDSMVQEHSKNPIEVEIVGLFDGVRLGANFHNPLEKKFIDGDNEYYKLIAKFRSPIVFIEKMAKKADRIWKESLIKSEKQSAKESELDRIISLQEK